jgi:hypothetical protein
MGSLSFWQIVLLEKPSQCFFDDFCSAHETVFAYESVDFVHEILWQLYSHIFAAHAVFHLQILF